MSWARNLLDERNTHAHMSSSQKDCSRSAGDLRPQGFGRVCPVIWDGWLCWPPTLAGTTIKQPCPDIYHFNTSQSAHRQCMRNGTWYRDWIPGSPHGWTNYTLCVIAPDVNHGGLSNAGASVLGYDVAPGATIAASGSEAKGIGNASTEPAEGLSSGVEVPVDAVLGTVVHGVSAVCLLLAVVTWITLRLTDRLATRRYQILSACMVAAFVFHVIVLTTHFQAMSVALSANVGGTTAAPEYLGSDVRLPQTGTSSGTHAGRAPGAVGTLDGTGHSSEGGMDGGAYAVPDNREASLSQSFDAEENEYLIGSGSQRAKKGAAGKNAGDDSWVTLCEVGRAFFLLSDVALYSFLFAMSLYYTLVVLGNTLNFSRLLTLFLLGLGLPAVFVVFSILLYTFLPSETGLGFSCTVASLDDEFHWATTGPKLICIVLSMCLMTVSTYGFWRLKFPALHTSSETFYARQGVVKTLIFLFIGSLAELFFLVTQYQRMYGLTIYQPIWYTSTAAVGVKGIVLSVLCCFLDTEVLHGTCCPSSGNVTETRDHRNGLRERQTRRDEEGEVDLYGGDRGFSAGRRERDEEGGGGDRSNRRMGRPVSDAEHIEIDELASCRGIASETKDGNITGLSDKGYFV
ncbi:hypothetical protein BaRGS_00036033 [Batillaria attramentaria]|uniref:Uncharacterized protein n=1 Tax=Batillaria attramentaria TaxID=370345 RepID=A0ABD0JCN5_9CAEN